MIQYYRIYSINVGTFALSRDRHRYRKRLRKERQIQTKKNIFLTYFSRSSRSSWLVSVKGTTIRGKNKKGTLLTIIYGKKCMETRILCCNKQQAWVHNVLQTGDFKMLGYVVADFEMKPFLIFKSHSNFKHCVIWYMNTSKYFKIQFI